MIQINSTNISKYNINNIALTVIFSTVSIQQQNVIKLDSSTLIVT